MTREPKCAVFRSTSGVGRSLLALVILMLVGLGFTLMSATAIAGDHDSRCVGGATDTVPRTISLSG